MLFALFESFMPFELKKKSLLFLRLPIKIAVGRLKEGTNILAVPHGTSVSLEIPFNVEISTRSSLLTEAGVFEQSFRKV